MKKYFKIFGFIAAISLLTSGCATHTGIGMSSASISENNFKMVRYAKGEATATKIFGIGGLGKDALVAEAKQDMLANYPLEEGQALANMTVDFKNSIVLIVITTKVTVTADIIQFE